MVLTLLKSHIQVTDLFEVLEAFRDLFEVLEVNIRGPKIWV